jgi:exopolysaccharide production protein ExoZ
LDYQKRTSLDSLQLIRAIAIILVVFHHAYNLIINYHNVNAPLLSVFEFGDLGVDLFFVLSGFIIFYVHQKDFNNKEQLKTYAYKRIARIFPVYWIVTLIFLSFVLFDRSFLQIITSLFLIPTGEQPIVGVAWSLQHEMLFYILFAFAIWNKRVFLPAVYLWVLITIFVNVFLRIELSNPLVALVLSPLNLEFLLGCTAAYIYRKYMLTNFGALALIGTLYILAAWVIQIVTSLEFNHVLAWGIPATLLILGLVSLERNKDIKINKTLVYIGDASYSIYLLHVTCILISEKISIRLSFYEHELLINIVAVITAVGSIIIGLLFYRFVEKPLLKNIKQRSSLRKNMTEGVYDSKMKRRRIR